MQCTLKVHKDCGKIGKMCRIDGSDERSQFIVDNVKKFDARNFAKQLLPKVTELFFYVQEKKHALERLLSEQ